MAEDDDDELLQMVRPARVSRVSRARASRNARARAVRAPRERAVFSFLPSARSIARRTNIASHALQALAMSLQQANAQQRGAGSGDGADAAGGSGEPRPSRAGRDLTSPASRATEHKRRRTSGEAKDPTDPRETDRDAAADLEEAIRRSLRDVKDPSDPGDARRSSGAVPGTESAGEPNRAVPPTAPPPATSMAVDAAALAAAFAGASAETGYPYGPDSGRAGARNQQNQRELYPDDARKNNREGGETTTASGVAVSRPALASSPADEAWWRIDDDDDGDDDKSVPASATCPDPSAACALLTELLGCAVAHADARTPGTSAGIPLPIPFVGGFFSVSKRVLDASATLAAVHARAVAKSPANAVLNSTKRPPKPIVDADDKDDAWSSRLATLVRASCAAKLMASLEDDGDDLYFEGGRHRTAFFAWLGAEALKRDPAADASVARLLEDMLDMCVVSPRARRAWLDVLRAAFAYAASAKLDAVDGLDVPLAALAALFRRPRLARAFRETLRAEARGDDKTRRETRGSETPGGSGSSTRIFSVLGSSRVASVSAGSALGALLSRGALPNVLSGPLGSETSRSARRNPVLDANGAAACAVFRASLRGYPEKTPPGDREKLRDIMQRGTARAYDAAHACALRCIKLPAFNARAGGEGGGEKSVRTANDAEPTLAWLAAATTALEREHACRGAKTHGGDAFLDPRGAPDAFRLGATALALRFTRPIVANAEVHLAAKLCDFDGGLRALRTNWRHDWRADDSLARSPEDIINASRESSERHSRANATANRETSTHSFVHECFYAAARLFQTALPLALTRFEEASRLLRDRAAARAVGDDVNASGNETQNASVASSERDAVARDETYNAYADCALAALLEPSFARDACGFALLQAEWLARLAATEDADPETCRAAFARVPEGFVKATARWVCFVLRHGKAELLLQGGGGDGGGGDAGGAGGGSVASPSRLHARAPASPPLSVASLVRMACELLSRPALSRHPTVAASLVEMLQCVLIGESGFAGGSGAGLGVRGSATHELLVSSVLSSAEARTALAPALIRAYTTLDAVENLDVDRDRFDKFHTRNVISTLLRELWRVDECVASVANLAATTVSTDVSTNTPTNPLFASFASCALSDLMYVLSDALYRLRSVAEVFETRRSRRDDKDVGEDARASREDEETARFAKNQERTARGYLRYATETLALLNLIAGSELTARSFLAPTVVGNAAYAVVRFLECLLNEKADAACSALGGEKHAKKKVGFDRDALVLAICEFAVKADGADAADRRAGATGAFANALASESDYDGATMERARALLVARTFGPAVVPPRLRDLIDRADAARAGAARRDAAADGGAAADDGAARVFDPRALLAALGPDAYEEDEAREAEAYKAAFSGTATAKEGLNPLRTFGETDDGAGFLDGADGDESRETFVGDFFPPFAKLAREAAGAGAGAGAERKRARALAKEAAAMSSPGALPLELGSSIFYRHDPDRLDLARVVIVGPADTPYEGGAFAFDVLCPAGYPDHPPMVNLATTGGGRARFNPNLYADGKVCLSLLGTWHGGAAEEKWDANRSTLAQVFVSIQGLIFVDDPMFNEPGFDGLRGTKEGEEKSARYNAEIRLFTVRHAMIDALKKPRRGVAATVRTHFRLRRWSVMRAVARWCEEARDPVIQRRMREAAAELSHLLARNAEEGL